MLFASYQFDRWKKGKDAIRIEVLSQDETLDKYHELKEEVVLLIQHLENTFTDMKFSTQRQIELCNEKIYLDVVGQIGGDEGDGQ